MYLLNSFKHKSNKQSKQDELLWGKKHKETWQLRNAALLTSALAVPGLVGAGQDIHKGLNIEKDIKNKLTKNKVALIANHPDKLIGKDSSIIEAANKKFKQLSNEKDKLKELQSSTDELKNLKGIKKLKRSMGINVENKVKSLLDNMAEQQSKQLGKKVIFTPEQLQDVIKRAKLGAKVGYGLTALGTVSAGVATAKYINRKRKERNDKGKKRK